VHYFIQSAAFIVAKLEAGNAYIVKEADLDLLMSVVPDHAVEPRCNCGRNSLLEYFDTMDEEYFPEPSFIIEIDYEKLYKLAAEAGEVDYKETLILSYYSPQQFREYGYEEGDGLRYCGEIWRRKDTGN
jgi:hypothetical protein